MCVRARACVCMSICYIYSYIIEIKKSILIFFLSEHININNNITTYGVINKIIVYLIIYNNNTYIYYLLFLKLKKKSSTTHETHVL